MRPYHEPTVSTPLDWKEVKPALNRYAFTMEAIEKRLTRKGDLFLAIHDNKLAIENERRLSAFILSNS